MTSSHDHYPPAAPETDPTAYLQRHGINPDQWNAFWDNDAMITEFEPDAGIVPRPNQQGGRVRLSDQPLGAVALRFYVPEI